MTEIASKVCTKCGEEKGLDEFYKDKKTKDGLQSACKVCTRARNNSRYVRKTPITPIASDSIKNKVCSRCEEERPKSDFYTESRSKDRLNGVCAPCSRKYNNTKYNNKTTPTPTALRPDSRKVCSRCRAEKKKSKFNFDRQTKDGLSSNCISCKKSSYKERSEDLKDRGRAYYRENRDSILEKARRPEFRERVKARTNERYKKDPEFKSRIIMRAHLGKLLRLLKEKKLGHTSDLLGYSAKDLKSRIESQFKPGMSWSNHGEWHIDHKIPVTRFIERGETRPKIISALSNLQPIWSQDNLRKGNRWSG